jgi:hypothetical protein
MIPELQDRADPYPGAPGDPDEADQAVAELEPPVAPLTIEDIGIPADVLCQLLVKSLYGGEATGTELSGRLRVPFPVLEGLFEQIRQEHLAEVRGSGGTGPAAYRYRLTDLGRDRARQFMEMCGYIGPAPVPLTQYNSRMKESAGRRDWLDRQRVAEGFSHLVVNQAVLDQLGPAINSGKAIFLYGPPGNGKTVIAEGIGRAIGGDVYLPHAIDVDGQVITLFDPVNHQPIQEAVETSSIIGLPRDRRWIRVKRPVVTVGGELTLDMLDLSFNPLARFYEAPLQLKANGGVFIVDDFGRQRVRPRDLLNRWIVPLESRVDYLTLHTGKKFEVPFDVLIIFATNLKPETLADEAFLRRIPYKIFARNPTVEEFARIFAMNCRRRGLAFDPVIVEYLNRRYYQPRNLDMRACHPRDLVDQVVDLARYQKLRPAMTRDLLDSACTSYFLEESRPTDGKNAGATERVRRTVRRGQ